MGETTKTILVLLMAIAAITSSIFWFVDRPDSTTWLIRISTTALAIIFLAMLLYLQLRRDEAPDYLNELSKQFFNRDGFCFFLTASNEGGVCHVHAYFQNQFEHECIGRIAARPMKTFFGKSDSAINTLLFEIPCKPAAFGVASLPIPLPEEVQGTAQRFEIGASVTYPEGKGRRLRFKDGIFLRANTDFKDALASTTKAVNMMTLSFVSLALSSPAHMVVVLPDEVTEDLPDEIEPDIETIWKLGDPPLQ